MKVILKEDVPGLGEKGEVKDVAPGYGRNLLIPRGLAEEATPGRLRELQHQAQVSKKRSAGKKKRASSRRSTWRSRSSVSGSPPAKEDGCSAR